ncbi:MAG TPA: DUF2062 domain-containing protein [Bacteroidales bacterium]|nr:DUF2062 domain-containing protein [Bacteroidales bacterium]
MSASETRQKFSDLKCCVIVPTYNNDRTLEEIIGRVQEFTGDILVVNDGSTDRTAEILDGIRGIRVITVAKNTGKGNALRLGFKKAAEMGFRYAVTLDSDGQHYPEDLPLFIDAVEKEPGSLIIGARNMEQEGIPGSSHFGHKFSIFWFRVETGLRIPDVQSGFRLYPLEDMSEIRFHTRKFEFEVEVLVRLAWRNVNIIPVPVRVYYAPREERVSHFRKFTDFARVSAVNTLLVLMALLWVRPFLFAKGLKKKSIRGFIREYIINSTDSNTRLAWSVAVGTFIGATPFWGWQMVIAFSTAHFLKLNKFVTVAAANISIPPILPLILLLSYITGGWVLGLSTAHVNYSAGITLHWVKQNLVQYLVGSVVLGIIFAVVFGFTTLILLDLFRKKPVPGEKNGSGSPD